MSSMMEDFGETKANNLLCLEEHSKNPRVGDNIRAAIEIPETLPCLGFPIASVEGFVNLINPDTPCGRLPRPSKLPGECPVLKPGHDLAQGILSKFWNGKFLIDTARSTINHEGIIFVAGVDFEGVKETSFMRIRYLPNFQGPGLHFFCNEVKQNSSPLAKYDLDLDLLNLVGGRILHHYIRQNGWMLPEALLESTFDLLKTLFKSTKKFTAANLDLRIIAADIKQNIPRYQGWPALKRRKEIGMALIQVGEFMEASGYPFEDASDLYLQVAEGYHKNTDFELKGYLAAGLACKRALEYENARQHYVKGLSLAGRIFGKKNWDLQEESTKSFICNLLVLQHEMATRASKVSSDEEKFWYGLVFLLGFARFDPQDDTLKAVITETMKHKDLEVVFRPEYKKPKNAKQALLRIFRSGTVEGYKEEILSTTTISAESHNQQDDGFAPHPPKWAPPVSTQSLKPLCSVCHKMGTDSQKTLLCICRQISYCSKECQVKDWKRHKRTSCWHKEHGKNASGNPQG